MSLPAPSAGRFEVITVTLNPAIDRTLTIPRFTAGTVNRVLHEESRAGGKGINVANVLAHLGHRVAATGILGDENDGCFKTLFAANHIHDACVRIPGATRLGIKVFDPDRIETTDVNLPGLAPGGAALEQIESLLLGLTTDWCVLAGSLPPGVPVTYYADLIRQLRRRGVRVALDTSGEPLRAALSAGPTLIKPNRHELEQLLGRTLDTAAAQVEAARSLLSPGISEVILSQGESGAWFVTTEHVLHARPPTVAVRSTVGAGDAMVAGVVSAHLRGIDPAARARFATATSLAALTRAPSDAYSAAALAELGRLVTIS
ncbi:MAG: 1-phosphofructokinase [Opitutaceae bacterium]|nr:1-phosphofructokinase [Opitutaceae bacterium]